MGRCILEPFILAVTCVTALTAVETGSVDSWELAEPRAGQTLCECISQPPAEDQLPLQSPSGRTHDCSRGGGGSSFKFNEIL